MSNLIYLSTETTDSYLKLLGGIGSRLPITEGDGVFFNYRQKSIWVERKRILDLCICVCYSHRLNSQVRRMQSQGQGEGQYDWAYLFVEDLWRPGADGLIEIQKWNPTTRKREWGPLELPGGSHVEYARIDNYLNTLEVVEGITVKRVNSEKESAKALIDLFHWWQKPIEDHNSTRQWQRQRVVGNYVGQVSLLRRWAMELPGVGNDLSARVEEKFGSGGVVSMVLAEKREWMEIEGIGKGKAEKIRKEIAGE